LLDAAAEDSGSVRPYLFSAYGEEDAPALAALNGGLVQDGAFLHVPRGFESADPYRVRIRTALREGMILPRNVVAVEEAGRATFVEEYSSRGGRGPVFANSVTEVRVGRGASLDILTLIHWDDAVSCCHRAVARIAEGGRLRWYLGTVGGALVRVDVETYLEGPGAESYIVGIGVGDGRRHLDHRTVQDHRVGDTRSRIHFGTLLKGASRSIYRGLIRMEEEALRSDAYQKNDNLMLESGPEATAIPMLEILTDDVKCSHGSTVGRIGGDEIFYLKSRGIPEEAARNLIAGGFIRRQLECAGKWNPLTEELHGILKEHALGLEQRIQG
jgi:Fe-S cluster assembly protein SufD